MKELRADLEVVLPEDASECEECVARLLETLGSLPAVGKAHVEMSDGSSPVLCLHYDGATLSMHEVKSLAAAAGAKVATRFEHLAGSVDGLRHERQARLAKSALMQEPGILHVGLGFGARRIIVEFDPRTTSQSEVLEAVVRAGLRIAGVPDVFRSAEARPENDGDHEHGGLFGEHSELVFSLACGVLTGVGWLLGRLDLAPLVPLLCFVAAYILGAWFTLQEVAVALRGRRFEIDFLMLLAAVGAAVLGEWFEGALLLFLFALGHSLEGFAMSRARRAIEALQDLVPETAVRLDDAGGDEEVRIEDLVLGDRLLIKPNTRVPADGFVVAGTSAVNQAPITGESVPVDKGPVPDPQAALADVEALPGEQRVYAGTVNGGGVLTIVVTKLAGDSAIARVVKMVQAAETQRSPTQRFTERFERVFVPVILAFVVVLLFAWVVVNESFARIGGCIASSHAAWVARGRGCGVTAGGIPAPATVDASRFGQRRASS